MALNIYYDKDADLGRLEGKIVAVIGYGSQGHAHSQNLHHSGVDVVVGLRKDSPSWAKAEEAGLRVMTPAAAANAADIVMMTLPDETTARLSYEDVELIDAKRRMRRGGGWTARAPGFQLPGGRWPFA